MEASTRRLSDARVRDVSYSCSIKENVKDVVKNIESEQFQRTKGTTYAENVSDVALNVGTRFPLTNHLGQTMTFLNSNPMQKAFEQQTPVGSGLCNRCFYEEQELLKQAQLRQAQEVLETPSTWTCSYCNAVNRGNFCFNCGSARQKILTKS